MLIRRYFKTASSILVLAVASVLALSCAKGDEYVVISGYAQGGTYAVKFNLNGKDGRVRPEPEEIRDSIDAILQRIDRSLSGYNKNSILSRFNAGETVCPDEFFFDLYEKSYAVYQETRGVVDVASAPLFDIWAFGF